MNDNERLVLAILESGGGLTARVLKGEMYKLGSHVTIPEVYAMLGGLIKKGFVMLWTEDRILDGAKKPRERYSLAKVSA